MRPEAAKRLRIVRFDEDTATLREFEVAGAGRPVVDPVEGRLSGRRGEANGRGGHVAHGPQDS